MTAVDIAELVKAFGVPGAFIVWVIHTVITSRPQKQPMLMPSPDAITKRDLDDIHEKLDSLEKSGYATHAIVAEIKGHLAGMGKR